MQSTIQVIRVKLSQSFGGKSVSKLGLRSESENVKDKYNYTCQPETLVYFITDKDCCLLNNKNILKSWCEKAKRKIC